MRNTGNRILDDVLRSHEARQAQRPGRWAVLRWVPRAAFYATEEEARSVLAATPVGRRAGLVDCDTGDTWVNPRNFAAVMAAVRQADKTPERFRRVGKLGPIEREPTKRALRTR